MVCREWRRFCLAKQVGKREDGVKKRDAILLLLREQAPDLRASGVSHLRLFGSAARDQMEPGSDIDLLADFDGEATVTLVTLGRLAADLSGILGAEVDLSSSAWMHEGVREQVLSEAVVAF